jgi:DNA-binding protein
MKIKRKENNMNQKTKTAYYKVLDTIKSCKTKEQISVAVQFVNIFVNQFRNDINLNDVEMITDVLTAQKIKGFDTFFAAQMIRIPYIYQRSNKPNLNLYKVFKFGDHIINHPYQIK